MATNQHDERIRLWDLKKKLAETSGKLKTLSCVSDEYERLFDERLSLHIEIVKILHGNTAKDNIKRNTLKTSR